MYLPRQLISHLYLQLLRSHHPLSPPVLILVALEPDALCACRILTALLKRDYIPHKIQPVAGYGDLARAGKDLVQPMQTTNGGSGGVVVCLGVGGLVDLGEILGLSQPDDEVEDMGGVEIWVLDARRPWNLGNVFGGQAGLSDAMAEIDANARRRGRGVEKGCITPAYTSKNGGIVVFDDGDIEEELGNEREAYYALLEMPEVDEDDDVSDEDGDDHEMPTGSKKRKSWSGREADDESEDEDGPPRQRKRSNSVRMVHANGQIQALTRVTGFLTGLISKSSKENCRQLVEFISFRNSHHGFALPDRTKAAISGIIEATPDTTQKET